jgi:PAS domain S-box-containing protein
MNERLRRPLFLTLAVLLAAVDFWIDAFVRFEISIAILYAGVVVLAYFAGGEKTVARAGWACAVLAIVAAAIGRSEQASAVSVVRLVLTCGVIGLTASSLVVRKRLETTKNQLERSRFQVELFANSVPFVLWHSNPQGEIVYLNESWTAVTGLDRWSVLEGQRYNDVVHPDDMAALVETVTHAVATQTITNLKVRIRQADGAYRWMQIYDNPALSPLSGEVERFGGLSDVHDEIIAKEELQKVRNELEASKAELVNFTDSVPQILWRADAGAKIDFFNRRYTEVTGRDFQEAIDRQNFMDDIHPDDRQTYLANRDKALNSGEELRETFRLRHANGGYRWMSLVGRPVRSPDGSEEVRYYGGISDIHDEVTAHQKVRELNETLEQRVAERTGELMRTERRYAGLFDVSNMTFAEMDFSAAHKTLDAIKASGVTDLRAYLMASPDELAQTLSAIQTTRVNEALARMMGYESVADLVANPPAQNADDGPEVLLRQLEMYYYGIDHIDGRTVLTGKGGRRIPIYFTVTRLPEGVHLSSHLDLSDQERIEDMRRAAQAELARANRVATVGAFSASIAHELNQPIASMLMDAQTGRRLVGRDTPDIETLTRILERVERTAQRVAGIVQRTRENIMAGRRAATAIDLCRLASDTRDLLDHDLKRAGVELEIVCTDPVPMINGDPVELQQVFVNLVTNAADAMRDQPGARRITLEIVVEEEALRVRVTDTGPGIPEALLERLFEPFFTTKSTGIGMGLQICRSAVEAMGGQLTVTNQPQGGASFSFDLPLGLDEPTLAR